VPDQLAAPVLVSLADVREAAARLEGAALRTPLLPLAGLPAAYLKAESLQPTGAFKLRGAYNAIAQLPPEQLARGVVTHSSGNHGQAVAFAARLLGTRAVVVMPDNAPPIKVQHVRALGGEVEFVRPSQHERKRRARELVDAEGLQLIPSADDPRVIAGQGTVGLEIVEQLAERGGPAAESKGLAVLVPISGGGLAAGVSTAVKALRPDARVFGVEPALAADAHESLASGRIVEWPSEKVHQTMADGLRLESLVPLAFAHLQRDLDDVLIVEEEEIAQAVARAAIDARLVLEPSGAASLAALLRYGPSLAPGVLVAVASGGNVEPERYAEILHSYHRR
jgi:threo-3-hydroxy-L-aspartate ammonia-lyase